MEVKGQESLIVFSKHQLIFFWNMKSLKSPGYRQICLESLSSIP